MDSLTTLSLCEEVGDLRSWLSSSRFSSSLSSLLLRIAREIGGIADVIVWAGEQVVVGAERLALADLIIALAPADLPAFAACIHSNPSLKAIINDRAPDLISDDADDDTEMTPRRAHSVDPKEGVTTSKWGSTPSSLPDVMQILTTTSAPIGAAATLVDLPESVVDDVRAAFSCMDEIGGEVHQIAVPILLQLTSSSAASWPLELLHIMAGKSKGTAISIIGEFLRRGTTVHALEAFITRYPIDLTMSAVSDTLNDLSLPVESILSCLAHLDHLLPYFVSPTTDALWAPLIALADHFSVDVTNVSLLLLAARLPLPSSPLDNFPHCLAIFNLQDRVLLSPSPPLALVPLAQRAIKRLAHAHDAFLLLLPLVFFRICPPPAPFSLKRARLTPPSDLQTSFNVLLIHGLLDSRARLAALCSLLISYLACTPSISHPESILSKAPLQPFDLTLAATLARTPVVFELLNLLAVPFFHRLRPIIRSILLHLVRQLSQPSTQVPPLHIHRVYRLLISFEIAPPLFRNIDFLSDLAPDDLISLLQAMSERVMIDKTLGQGDDEKASELLGRICLNNIHLEKAALFYLKHFTLTARV